MTMGFVLFLCALACLGMCSLPSLGWANKTCILGDRERKVTDFFFVFMKPHPLHEVAL